ncbi:MAG: hypothetical protein ABSA74_01385 [Candidatus Staskawiczbacteria bacterium]|jgi:hypothetical protein
MSKSKNNGQVKGEEIVGLSGGLGRGVLPETKTEGKKSRSKKQKAEKPEADKPVVESAVVAEQPPVVETPKPEAVDPFAGLFEAGEALEAANVAATVEKKNSILANEKAVAIAMKAFTDADNLAIDELKQDRVESEAREEWYKHSFAELEDKVKSWANAGNGDAAKILKVFAQLRQISAIAIEPLWRPYKEIIRRSRSVNSFPALVELLKWLEEKNLVEREFDKRRSAKAVRTKAGDFHYNYWLPLMEGRKAIQLIEIAWPSIKEAEVRALEWESGKRTRFTELKGSATKNYFLANAEAGYGGTIFLEAGQSKGALIQVQKNGDRIRVRAIAAVGLPIRTPTEWLPVDAEQKAWPDEKLFPAFVAWKKKTPPESMAPKPEPAPVAEAAEAPATTGETTTAEKPAKKSRRKKPAQETADQPVS